MTSSSPDPDELIGDQQAIEAEAPADHELLQGGDGDRPGAVLDLPAKELGRHGRLAMGCDGELVGFDEGAHPAAVVLQGRAAEHRQGKGQIAPQQVPALPPDGAQLDLPRPRRDAFDGGGQGMGREGVEGVALGAGGQVHSRMLLN